MWINLIIEERSVYVTSIFHMCTHINNVNAVILKVSTNTTSHVITFLLRSLQILYFLAKVSCDSQHYVDAYCYKNVIPGTHATDI